MDGFHTHDGWFWKRLDDGSVQVAIQHPKTAQIVEMQVLPAMEWASVVASVCGRGETSESYQEALALHSQNPDSSK